MHFKRYILASCALTLALVTSSGCATTRSSTGSDQAPASRFVSLDSSWRVLSEEDGDELYQATFASADDQVKLLLGRLPMDPNERDSMSYLGTLHSTIITRIRGESGAQPFLEDTIEWSNGAKGLRTLLRGDLGESPIVIEGLTLTDSANIYFVYGRFPESEYQQRKPAFNDLLASIAPLAGATQLTRAQIAARDVNPLAPVRSTKNKTSVDVFPNPEDSLGAFRWGADMATFRERLGEPYRSSEVMLAYEIDFAEVPSTAVFLFAQNRFVRSVINLDPVVAEPSENLSAFLELDRRLSESYGDPVQRAAIWSSERYKMDQAQWPTALVEGDVVFGTIWQMGSVKIIHSLKSDGLGGITHRLVFKNASQP